MLAGRNVQQVDKCFKIHIDKVINGMGIVTLKIYSGWQCTITNPFFIKIHIVIPGVSLSEYKRFLKE